MPARQSLHDFVELFEIAILDMYGTALTAMIDTDSQSKYIRHTLFERDRIGVLLLRTT